MERRGSALYGVSVARTPPTNVDLLSWFGEDERAVCDACGERSCVTLAGADARFCLACGAVTVDGARL